MKWEILEKTRLYQGFFSFWKFRLRHVLYSGEFGPIIERELLEQHHAVAVLLYDPERDEIVLIEQFRIGAINRDAGPWVTEIVAGIQEPGEFPEDVARREALEEAGCKVLELRRIHRYLPTPSSSTEEITVFVARVDSAQAGGIHGIADEGEDIKVKVVTSDEAFAMMDEGIIDSAIPIIALQWLRLNRQALRDDWAD